MRFPISLTEARGFRAGLISLLAGALAALALPPLHMLPVLLVAFPVLLTLIGTAARPAFAACRGWCFGLGYHMVGLYWITEAILFEAERFWWLVPLAVPALSAVLAVFVGMASWAAWYATPHRSAPMARPLTFNPGMDREDAPLRADSNPSRPGEVQEAWPSVTSHSFAQAGAWPIASIAALAGAWGLTDLARQFVCTGFPWNPLGSVWAIPGWFGDVMLQPASLVSVHGLTIATVVLACAPMLAWRGRALGFTVLLLWIGFGINRIEAPPPPDQNLRVVLVQGNVAQGQKWDPALVASVFEKYLRLTAEGLREAGASPRVAVWPETASFYRLETDPGAREAIAAAANGALVLAGAVRFDADDHPRNSLFAVTAEGKIASLYDKWHLVPLGEYQPSWARIGIQLVPGGGFAPGPGPETLHVPGLPPVGPLICYEAIFPGQVVNENDRPEWMVNVTNDAWFGTSTGPRQHLAAARLRAVEEGLPLLRAANTGITVAFDSRGHEITRIGMEETGFRLVTLPGRLPRTIFGRLGLWDPSLLAVGMLGFGLAGGRAYRLGRVPEQSKLTKEA